MTKLSIITICYNNFKGLLETQKSIACQTWRDYEWIVVDGGSTDDSKNFITAHQEEMAWWCSEPDNGIYDAQNKGIAHAKGEYLLFLNAGDTLFAYDTLDKLFAQAVGEDVVYGDWFEYGTRGRKKLCHSPKHTDYYALALRPLCHQTAFIRSSLLKESPYDTSYKICADWAKWVELAKRGHTFRHIPLTVCNYMRNGISYRATKQKRKEHKRILEAFYHQELAKVLWQLIEKNEKRLKAIRLLAWTATALAGIVLAGALLFATQTWLAC